MRLLLADDRRHDPEDRQRRERHHPQQDLHQQLEADRQQVDDDLERRVTLGLPRVADLHQADAQGQRQDDELRQVVLGERLADAPGDEVDQQVGDRLLGRRLRPRSGR